MYSILSKNWIILYISMWYSRYIIWYGESCRNKMHAVMLLSRLLMSFSFDTAWCANKLTIAVTSWNHFWSRWQKSWQYKEIFNGRDTLKVDRYSSTFNEDSSWFLTTIVWFDFEKRNYVRGSLHTIASVNWSRSWLFVNRQLNYWIYENTRNPETLVV